MADRTAGELLADRGSTSAEISRDEIFDLISNHRRRYVIHYCTSVDDGRIELSDLAEQVAAWELEKEIDQLTSDERKTVYTSLQQTHLPRLERAGMITFESGHVEPTDELTRLTIYLDIVPENSIPWSVYYLGLSILSSIVLGGLWLDLLPTEAIPPLAYPTALVGLFVISAGYHVLVDHQYRLGDLERPQ